MKYYYRSINDKEIILNIESKSKRASYFKEGAGFYFEEYTRKLSRGEGVRDRSMRVNESNTKTTE